MTKPEPREIYQARINQALEFINHNLAETLSLEQIAQAAGFSPFHFHRIFQAIVGETPHDFVNRLRLERAANMLVKNRSLSITEIGLSCGFSSSATFARAFKKQFGQTAGQYRANFDQLSGPTGQATGALLRRSTAAASTLPLEVEVKMMPPFHVAYVPNLAGYDVANICRAWTRLYKWTAARDLIAAETKMIGLSFDDPLITAPDKCRYYACVTVPETVVADDKVSLMDIPAGKYAVGHLTCSAQEIELAYRSLFAHWLPNSGYQPADRPSYDIYHATPDTTTGGNFVMDICLPVQPL